MKKKNRVWIYPLIIIGALLMLTSSCKTPTGQVGSTVTDIDGNVYNTITIGTQVWMVENLKTTKYRDGSPIPNVTDDKTWESLTTGAYCNYNNDENNSTAYGRLYNWYAVNDSRNIAPTGWHVPTDAEWTTLENYLIANGYNYDGTTSENKIAKSLATSTGWNSSTNKGAVGNTDYPEYRNKSGFSALPSGLRDHRGEYDEIGKYCIWWSSTSNTQDVMYRTMCYGDWRLHWNYQNDHHIESLGGFSVRCLKDF